MNRDEPPPSGRAPTSGRGSSGHVPSGHPPSGHAGSAGNLHGTSGPGSVGRASVTSPTSVGGPASVGARLSTGRMSAIPSSVPGPPRARMKRLLKKQSRVLTDTPLEFQLLGKTLLHAALVGAAAGLLGSLFVALVELVQRVVLEALSGYQPLKAAGELF